LQRVETLMAITTIAAPQAKAINRFVIRVPPASLCHR
jgi:hypothetical protein